MQTKLHMSVYTVSAVSRGWLIKKGSRFTQSHARGGGGTKAHFRRGCGLLGQGTRPLLQCVHHIIYNIANERANFNSSFGSRLKGWNSDVVQAYVNSLYAHYYYYLYSHLLALTSKTSGEDRREAATTGSWFPVRPNRNVKARVRILLPPIYYTTI